MVTPRIPRHPSDSKGEVLGSGGGQKSVEQRVSLSRCVSLSCPGVIVHSKAEANHENDVSHLLKTRVSEGW